MISIWNLIVKILNNLTTNSIFSYIISLFQFRDQFVGISHIHPEESFFGETFE